MGAAALAIVPRYAATVFLAPATMQVALLVLGGLGLVILFVGVGLLSRSVETGAMHALRHLIAELKRTVAAERHGRRGDVHLQDEPGDPEEVLALRAEIRALHTVVQGRLDAEQRWFGSVIHDMKAGLMGLAHLLDAEEARGNAAGVPVNDSISSARDEAKRLTELLGRLTDLMRFARLESVSRHPVDLETLLTRVTTRAATYQNDRITVDLTCPRPVTVDGDEILLDRAFTNLVENACRVARTRVEVGVYPNLVRIEDDGPGLSESLDALSRPFRSEVVRIDGVPIAGGALGLGLFVARRALEIHDGRLAVERTGTDGTVILAYLGRGR